MRAGISLPTRAVCVSVCVSHMYHMRTCCTDGTAIRHRDNGQNDASVLAAKDIYETTKEGRVSHASRINYSRVACVYHSLYTIWLCAAVRFKVPLAAHISHPHPPILLPSLYYMCEVR